MTSHNETISCTMTQPHHNSFSEHSRRKMASPLTLFMLALCSLSPGISTTHAQTTEDAQTPAAVAEEENTSADAIEPDAIEPDANGESDPQGTDEDAAANSESSDGTSEGTSEGQSETGDSENASGDNRSEDSFLMNLLQTPPIGYLFQGGLFMWPILIMGIIGAGVIIERYRSLNMLSGDSLQLREDVNALLESDQVREAFELCNGQQGPVPAILATGLRKYLVLQTLHYEPAKIEEKVVKSMDDYSVHIVAALERHLPILATISSAAPMLGFLGTVQGMIVAFDDIVAKMGETNIVSAAAEGIKVSLMTTCFGLIVGIPAFVAFNYFTGIINRFVLDVEESATEMIEAVTLQTAIGAVEGEVKVEDEAKEAPAQ